MWRKNRLLVLALALMLALAPAAPRAEAGIAAPDRTSKVIRYVACAGSIVFMIAVPASVFYTTLVCINAFLGSND